MPERNTSNLVLTSLLAALLLTTLCAMTAVSGVSQQRFEWVQLPDAYAAMLVAQGGWLRLLIAVDALFIAAYVFATVTLAQRIAAKKWSALTISIAVGGVVAGVLDLHENHDLLSMLRLAEFGGAISVDAIVQRSDLSQLKWMLGHLAFVGVGLAWPRRDTPLDRVLVFSLVGFQLPLGVAVWTLTDPMWLEVAIWARYASFLSGFLTIAWLNRARSASPAAPFEPARGAPA